MAAAFLVFMAIACAAASLIAPYSPSAQDLTQVLAGPSWHHLLGTDELGRDVLSRLLYGGRRSLEAVLVAVSVVLVVGVPLGLLAGYMRRWHDWVIMRGAEVVQSVPAIILVLLTLAIFPENEVLAMVLLGLIGSPQVIRVVRSSALQASEELHVTAARVSGLSHMRVLVRHVAPRVRGPVVVQASLFAAYALLFETGLSYLGLTANPATPSWGAMVGDASAMMLRQSWLLVPTGGIIALTILAFLLVGDAMADAGARRQQSSRSRRRRSGLTTIAAADASAILTDERPGLLSSDRLSVTVAERDHTHKIVDDVSLSVRAGQTLGVVGESGSGKTVTALAMLRLLPPEMMVAGGRVALHERDLTALSDEQFDALRGSDLAYVAQNPITALDPTFTVGAQLTEVLVRHHRHSRRQARARAVELLEQVGLTEPQRVLGSYPHELSGGMAQRVTIAVAIAGDPKILIADEPTTALDVKTQEEILQLLQGIQTRCGLAIILITHDWSVIVRGCDRAVVMYAGQIVEEGPVEALLDQPLHPYTLGLLRSAPQLATPKTQLPAITGAGPEPDAWPSGCRFAPRCPHAIDACRGDEVAMRVLTADRSVRCIRAETIAERVIPVAG